MPLPPTAKKLLPLLLIVSAALIVIGDQVPFKLIAHSPANHETSSGSPKLSGEKIRDHGSESDHQDPEKNKRMGIFHYNEGNKSFLSGNLEEAVKNYKMALHHDKDFVDARINLSTAYLKEKQYDKALETLKAVQEKHPSNPNLHYNVGCYYSLTGNIDQSLESIKKSVQLGFKNVQAIHTDPDLENLRKEPVFKEWFETL